MSVFQRELRQLAASSCQLTNGQVAVSSSDEDLLRFKIKIRPNSGLYQGSLYEFTIRASDNHPRSPPIVMSCSYILHPNINEYGEVYLECLERWPVPTFDLCYLVKSLLQLFHRPDFTNITNDEVRDWTDVEFIRNVTAWKHTQTLPASQNQLAFGDTLGFGSCVSLMSVSGHQETNCDCNNEYIVVTNSRRPRPSSARRALQHPQRAWQQNTHFHSTSTIDLSDVHDSLGHAETDYEIRSVSSDEDNIPRREIVHDRGPLFDRPARQADSRQSRQNSARSRLSSRLQSRENTWNSHTALADTPSISINRNSAEQKPDFRKDLNNFL